MILIGSLAGVWWCAPFGAWDGTAKAAGFKTPILFFLERKKRMRLLMV